MTFTHKLSKRLALMRDVAVALPLAVGLPFSTSPVKPENVKNNRSTPSRFFAVIELRSCRRQTYNHWYNNVLRDCATWHKRCFTVKRGEPSAIAARHALFQTGRQPRSKWLKAAALLQKNEESDDAIYIQAVQAAGPNKGVARRERRFGARVRSH